MLYKICHRSGGCVKWAKDLMENKFIGISIWLLPVSLFYYITILWIFENFCFIWFVSVLAWNFMLFWKFLMQSETASDSILYASYHNNTLYSTDIDGIYDLPGIEWIHQPYYVSAGKWLPLNPGCAWSEIYGGLCNSVVCSSISVD